MGDEQEEKICKLCNKKPSRYTCPRCHVPYCTSTCYKGPQHTQCSEVFYKEQVQQQLCNHKAPEGSRAKMKEMLKRLEDEDEAAAHLRDQFQDQEFEGEEQGEEAEEEEELDSDDDEDLSDRLKDVDLDDSEAVWERLTEQERRQFCQLVESGDVSSIVPTYTPWWWTSEHGGQDAPAIVELSEQEAEQIKENTTDTKPQDTEQIKEKMQDKRAQERKENSVQDTRVPETKDEHLRKEGIKKSGQDEQLKETCKNKCLREDTNNKSCKNELSKENSNYSPTNKPIANTMDKKPTNDVNKTKEISSKSFSGTKNGCTKSTKASCAGNPKAVAAGERRRPPASSIAVFSGMPASLRTKYKDCPQPVPVKPLSSLMAGTPSPLLRFSIANAVASYAWTVRLYNGDHHSSRGEAAEVLLTLSAALHGDGSFSSIDEVFASINMRALQHEWLCASQDFVEEIASDTVSLMSGPRDLPGCFLHVALADLRALVLAAVTAATQDKNKVGSSNSFVKSMQGAAQAIPLALSSSTSLKKVARKIDFFLAYAEAHKQDLQRGMCVL